MMSTPDNQGRAPGGIANAFKTIGFARWRPALILGGALAVALGSAVMCGLLAARLLARSRHAPGADAIAPSSPMTDADRELAATVSEIAATLDLPRGQVSRAEIDRWRDGLAARGWQRDDHRAHGFAAPDHDLMTHQASGYRAAVDVLRYDPARPDSPVFDAAERDDLRYAIGMVRISGPEGSNLLADARGADARADGSFAWVLSRPAQETDDTPATGTPPSGAPSDRASELMREAARPSSAS